MVAAFRIPMHDARAWPLAAHVKMLRGTVQDRGRMYMYLSCCLLHCVTKDIKHMKETMMDYRITESYVVEARIVHMHTARARERVSGGRSNKYVCARAPRGAGRQSLHSSMVVCYGSRR